MLLDLVACRFALGPKPFPDRPLGQQLIPRTQISDPMKFCTLCTATPSYTVLVSESAE